MTITAHYVKGKRDARNYAMPKHEPHWTDKERREYDRGYSAGS